MAKQNEDVMTINAESLMMPMALFLSALVLATSILVGFLQLSNAIKEAGGISTGNDDVVVDAGDVAAPTVQVDEGKTTIDNDPYLGDKGKAKVAIVEFTDFECPYCQRHHQETYPQIIENFVNTGDAIYVSRDFPLSFHNPVATTEAIAAQCVFDQEGNEAYFEFSDLVFTNTQTNGSGVVGGEETLANYAEQSGANKSEFKDCLSQQKFAQEVIDDTTAGSAAGVNGTPAFVIGTLQDDGTVDGVLISGAQPYSQFEAAIKAQLEK